MSTKHHSFLIGVLLALIPGIFWGLSGVYGQFLFQERNISPEWLVTVRLLLAGGLLTVVNLIRTPKKSFAIWKDRQSTKHLIIFSLLGTMAVQLTYFVAIAKSNAPTATILQYLFPVMIVLATAVIYKRLPMVYEIVAVLLAIVGTLLLVTHGDLHRLHISLSALIWGIVSAAAMAFYSMYPGKLQLKWGSAIVSGWSMLLGGIFINFYHPFWNFQGILDLKAIMYILFIIVMATALSFSLYLVSVKMIGATYAGLFACIEPVASAFFSVWLLGLQFSAIDYLGAGMILGMMLLLSVVPLLETKKS